MTFQYILISRWIGDPKQGHGGQFLCVPEYLIGERVYFPSWMEDLRTRQLIEHGRYFQFTFTDEQIPIVVLP